MTAIDPVIIMKQEVGKAAANLVQSNSVVGLGTGSTEFPSLPSMSS